jgi:CheY-like chemotaxis protein
VSNNVVDNKKILLVDDSVDHQELLTMLFEEEGFDLKCASNGKEALELLRSMPELPAFILLDMMMPIMDGYTFRENQIKNPRLASIPVVVMTADNSVVAKSKDLGVAEFINKPANIEDLLEAAKRYCGGSFNPNTGTSTGTDIIPRSTEKN